MTKYTLVQHSGYGYGNDLRFKRAVETHAIPSPAIENKIQQAGGLVFNSYSEANEAEQRYNYPPEVEGLIPRCNGTFIALQLDELAVFVPDT